MEESELKIVVWNDYICPWAYAARPLTDWLVEEAAKRNLSVEHRCYELHPDLPPEGKEVRPGGRLEQVFDHIGEECAASGLAFNKPTRSPNSHRLLGLVEIVRMHYPEHWAEVDRGFAEAHWVHGRQLDDPSVVRSVLTAAALDADVVLNLEADGVGERLLEEAHEIARESGVTGTPAWQVGDLVITGLHPREQFERWFSRIFAKRGV